MSFNLHVHIMACMLLHSYDTHIIGHIHCTHQTHTENFDTAEHVVSSAFFRLDQYFDLRILGIHYFT